MGNNVTCMKSYKHNNSQLCIDKDYNISISSNKDYVCQQTDGSFLFSAKDYVCTQSNGEITQSILSTVFVLADGNIILPSASSQQIENSILKTEIRPICIDKSNGTIFNPKLKYVCNQTDGTITSPQFKHVCKGKFNTPIYNDVCIHDNYFIIILILFLILIFWIIINTKLKSK